MELVDSGSDNNIGSNWAVAVARGGTYTGNGDLGTPGALNSVSGGAKPTPNVFAQPLAWQLGNAEPNPFNPATRIRFAVQEPEHVTVRVFDVRGRLIVTLVNDRLEPGWHDVEWRGLDRDSRPVSTGIYFVRMDASTFTNVRRITLVR